MITKKIEELSLENFSPYGHFANMINPNTEKLGAPPIEFYRDMVQLDLGTATHVSLSVCRVEKRPEIVDVTEYHNSCGEGLLPLDNDILIHVAPASASEDVPVDKIKIFRVPKGTLVVVKPGVYHHAPFVETGDCANVLIILPERLYARDCEVFELKKDQQIKIETK